MKNIILIDKASSDCELHEVNDEMLRRVRELLEDKRYPTCVRCGEGIFPGTDRMSNGRGGLRHTICPQE